MNVLELQRVTKSYGTGRQAFTALHTTSLALRAGEVVLITGPSGSGKTTLLSVMGCILKPTAGRVIVCGQDVHARGPGFLPAVRARYLGFIFQQYHLFPGLTATENVELTLVMKYGRRPGARSEARRLLDTVGLGHRLDAKPTSLSGGERQRVAIARALSGDPAVILADEPTAALDSRNAVMTVQLLARLAGEGRTVVLVSHDHRLERYATRTVRMEDGAIVEDSHSALAETQFEVCVPAALTAPISATETR